MSDKTHYFDLETNPDNVPIPQQPVKEEFIPPITTVFEGPALISGKPIYQSESYRNAKTFAMLKRAEVKLFQKEGTGEIINPSDISAKEATSFEYVPIVYGKDRGTKERIVIPIIVKDDPENKNGIIFEPLNPIPPDKLGVYSGPELLYVIDPDTSIPEGTFDLGQIVKNLKERLRIGRRES